MKLFFLPACVDLQLEMDLEKIKFWVRMKCNSPFYIIRVSTVKYMHTKWIDQCSDVLNLSKERGKTFFLR